MADLYESTGLNGQSSLREVQLETGAVLQRRDLPSDLFGEGLTNWGNTLVQLTSKAYMGFIYNRNSFALLRTFHYKGEGWGLTQDGAHLILSDGSSSLRFFDPETFQEVKRIVVSDGGVEVHNLNELEYIHGQIYANVWQTDLIAIISPKNGHVLGWADLGGLRPEIVRSNSDGFPTASHSMRRATVYSLRGSCGRSSSRFSSCEKALRATNSSTAVHLEVASKSFVQCER